MIPTHFAVDVRDGMYWMRRALLAMALGMALPGQGWAVDLMAPKEQQQTEVDITKLPEFDLQKKGVPQSLFAWIRMAKGYEIEWDSFGRHGWYTQDPRFKPIEPTSTFPAGSDPVYIVFETAPVEDPIQYSAQWFRLDEQGVPAETPVGRDILEQPGHSRYGFLELKPTTGMWASGTYLVKIYITPIGQQPFHGGNQVGTMRFTILDHGPASSGPASR